MSVRNYLDTRYTFPGYAFILFMVGISYPFFSKWLETFPLEVSGTVIGLITVFGISPLGYLISQVWYFFPITNSFRSSVYGNPNEGRKRMYVELLHNYHVRQDKASTIHVLDFFISNINENAKKYISKRWDMYNIMGSTVIAIIIGWLFGLAFRQHIESFFVTGPLLYEYVVSAIGLILVLLFIFAGMPIMRQEHEYMTYTVIKNKLRNPHWKRDLSNVFLEAE